MQGVGTRQSAQGPGGGWDGCLILASGLQQSCEPCVRPGALTYHPLGPDPGLAGGGLWVVGGHLWTQPGLPTVSCSVSWFAAALLSACLLAPGWSPRAASAVRVPFLSREQPPWARRSWVLLPWGSAASVGGGAFILWVAGATALVALGLLGRGQGRAPPPQRPGPHRAPWRPRPWARAETLL